MQNPVLIHNGQSSRFVTRYHERESGIVSAGPRYEFDVSPQIDSIKTDTRLGLQDALVNTAYGDGQSNIAQWLTTKTGLTDSTHPQARIDPVTRRSERLPTIQPRLEQKNNGWTLQLAHADHDSRYAPNAPTHIVTAEIETLRQNVVDEQLKRLGNAAWSEQRRDVMTWLNDLDISVDDNRHQPYGVAFSVNHKTTESRLDIPEPKLRPTPNFGRRF